MSFAFHCIVCQLCRVYPKYSKIYLICCILFCHCWWLAAWLAGACVCARLVCCCFHFHSIIVPSFSTFIGSIYVSLCVQRQQQQQQRSESLSQCKRVSNTKLSSFWTIKLKHQLSVFQIKWNHNSNNIHFNRSERYEREKTRQSCCC